MELLHTLVTYPTHEDRSHTPGQRRSSSSSAPQAPDIFLNFLGPIRHRLNVKATTGDTFDRTKSHFRQMKEKSKDSAAIKLTNLPGEAPARRNKFDFFRGRTNFHKPYQGRNPAKFPSRRTLTNGTLSPNRETVPPQQPKVCCGMFPD